MNKVIVHPVESFQTFDQETLILKEAEEVMMLYGIFNSNILTRTAISYNLKGLGRNVYVNGINTFIVFSSDDNYTEKTIDGFGLYGRFMSDVGTVAMVHREVKRCFDVIETIYSNKHHIFFKEKNKENTLSYIHTFLEDRGTATVSELLYFNSPKEANIYRQVVNKIDNKKK